MYVAPLPSDKEFTRGIWMKDKLVLHDQAANAVRALLEANFDEERRQRYWQLYQINAALCVPMPTMEALGLRPLSLGSPEES